MIGVLIIAHADLGASFIHCAHHVLGSEQQPLLHVANLPITLQDNPEQLLPIARKLVQALDQGQGVLVLSDICGATPCNIARRLVQPGKVACLAGLSLPMLIRALSYRHEALETVVEKASSGGKEGVMNIFPDGCNAA